ncbi:metallophosphoesterase family protein [Candidatus Poriferisocius sp.]|uniref:metallophosphoesterase family protein n=1 Tax=Candidatus Poriferisocius sp. TaxID=3101276 RepID=UPI003B027242
MTEKTYPRSRALSMLHTSDCHLGTSPARRQEAAFAAAIDLAIAEAVDAVIISGDLFDHNRVGDDVLSWAADQLARLSCPVVMIAGNHDAHPETSVLHRFGPHIQDLPVTVLDSLEGTTTHLPELDLTVWGKSMDDHHPGFHPLEGLPARPENGWCVAMGHGLVMPDESPSYRSSPIYPSHLDTVDWDYVALGHIHRHQVIRETPSVVAYSGATAESLEGEPAVVLVTLDPDTGVFLNLRELTPRGLPTPGTAAR